MEQLRQIISDALEGAQAERDREASRMFDPNDYMANWSDVYRLDGKCEALAYALGVIEAAID